jgi:putative transposase
VVGYKYSGMDASSVKRLKELEVRILVHKIMQEDENRRPKQVYANSSLEHQVLKDIVEKICNT